MDTITLISTLLTFIGQIPYVGPVISFIIQVAIPLAGVVTALVSCWHAVVVMVQAIAIVLAALGAIPGLAKLQNIAISMAHLAEKLKADEDKISGVVNSKVIPILNRLSVIPLPKAPSKAA